MAFSKRTQTKKRVFVTRISSSNKNNEATGAQKKIEIEDENKLRVFMERRMAEEVPADALGDEFKGYVFKITGGNDKDGFPMRQGVLVNRRVRLLLRRGMMHALLLSKKKGEPKRKAVRGCIVASDIAVLSLIIVKRGEQPIAGLTDTEVARRLGPKRVDKIKKMFNLTKSDDVRDYIVRRKYKAASGKIRVKKPKIQEHTNVFKKKKMLWNKRKPLKKQRLHQKDLRKKGQQKGSGKKGAEKKQQTKQTQSADQGKKQPQATAQQSKKQGKKPKQ
ncbi:40S ribosomal protein S6 [Reticulomyxa filosa]|uniref:40S ribosomal protein S6 n=1 Tax=Reticulomyxa filosa TaxID=46433 RepID=X6ML10_RETFI|nr:40S ribosomal protein S6 [Reticulomyxa filosa]|eukprot:ETO14316.1 40S ribosomal protein S6 [Reticulomyxa filosa]